MCRTTHEVFDIGHRYMWYVPIILLCNACIKCTWKSASAARADLGDVAIDVARRRIRLQHVRAEHHAGESAIELAGHVAAVPRGEHEVGCYEGASASCRHALSAH